MATEAQLKDFEEMFTAFTKANLAFHDARKAHKEFLTLPFGIQKPFMPTLAGLDVYLDSVNSGAPIAYKPTRQEQTVIEPFKVSSQAEGRFRLAAHDLGMNNDAVQAIVEQTNTLSQYVHQVHHAETGALKNHSKAATIKDIPALDTWINDQYAARDTAFSRPAAPAQTAAVAASHVAAGKVTRIAAAPAEKQVIEVKGGDSLSKIAGDKRLEHAREVVKQALGDKADDLTVRLTLSMALATKNAIEKPDAISVGMKLEIPTDADIKAVADKLKLTTMMDDGKISASEYKNMLKGKTVTEVLAPAATPAAAKPASPQRYSS